MTKNSLLILTAVLVVLASGAVWAQLDPGVKFNLYQNGQPVGEVFVPQRTTNVAYTEHWILYGNYQYPGPRYVGELLVAPIPSQAPYENADELLRAAPQGAKYVRVDVLEFDYLPGR